MTEKEFEIPPEISQAREQIVQVILDRILTRAEMLKRAHKEAQANFTNARLTCRDQEKLNRMYLDGFRLETAATELGLLVELIAESCDEMGVEVELTIVERGPDGELRPVNQEGEQDKGSSD